MSKIIPASHDLSVSTVKGEPRVDSRLLAARLGVQHQNTFELLKDYRADFEQLGVLRFETGKPSGGSAGGRPERFALLNEDQCYLLLTYSRNTAKVRELKVKLVKAFKEARLSRELTSTEYLPSYRALHDEIASLAAGSPNERHVHSNVNKLVNKTVGISAGRRGALPMPAKSFLAVAQTVAANAMHGAADHHEGYRRAKAALGGLAALAGGDGEVRSIGHGDS